MADNVRGGGHYGDNVLRSDRRRRDPAKIRGPRRRREDRGSEGGGRKPEAQAGRDTLNHYVRLRVYYAIILMPSYIIRLKIRRNSHNFQRQSQKYYFWGIKKTKM